MQAQALVHRPGPRSEGCPGDACARDYKLYKDYAHLLTFHARGPRAARAGGPRSAHPPLQAPRSHSTDGERRVLTQNPACTYTRRSPHAGVVPAVIRRKKRERARPRSSLRFLIFSHSAALPHESSLRSTLSFAASVSSLMNHCSMLDAETKRPTGVVSETACRRNRARARLRVIRPR